MSERLVTTVTLEDNQEYIVLDKMDMNNKSYIFLVSNNEEQDFLIQEYRKGGNKFYPITEEEFDLLLKEFNKRHENLKN